MLPIIPIINKPVQNEIEMMFTSDCNLKCDFCKVQHDFNFPEYNESVITKVVNHAITIVDALDDKCKTLDMTIYGGELFQDKYRHLDSVLGTKLVELVARAEAKGKTVSFTFMTNLITKDINRIIRLAKAVGAEVHPSFDFEGRFDNPKLIELWLSNFDALVASGVKVMVTFNSIRPNIEQIKAKNQIFEYIYHRSATYINDYNDVGLEGYALSEKELGEFYCFLYDNYPEVSNIHTCLAKLDGSYHGVACSYSTFIRPDGIHKECCNRAQALSEYIQNHGCLTCEYKSNCTMLCPRNFAHSKDCALRILLDHIKGKHNGTDR